MNVADCINLTDAEIDEQIAECWATLRATTGGWLATNIISGQVDDLRALKGKTREQRVAWLASKDDTEPKAPVNQKRKKPAVLVLEALLEGHEVKIGETTYVMGDRHDLCWVGLTDRGEKRYMVVLGAGMPEFIALCDSMTEAETSALGANVALNKIKAGR